MFEKTRSDVLLGLNELSVVQVIEVEVVEIDVISEMDWGLLLESPLGARPAELGCLSSSWRDYLVPVRISLFIDLAV